MDYEVVEDERGSELFDGDSDITEDLVEGGTEDDDDEDNDDWTNQKRNDNQVIIGYIYAIPTLGYCAPSKYHLISRERKLMENKNIYISSFRIASPITPLWRCSVSAFRSNPSPSASRTFVVSRRRYVHRIFF